MNDGINPREYLDRWGLSVEAPEEQKPLPGMAEQAGLHAKYFVSRVADMVFLPVRDIAFSAGNIDHSPGTRLANTAYKSLFNMPMMLVAASALLGGSPVGAAAAWVGAMAVPMVRQLALCLWADMGSDRDEENRQQRYMHRMYNSPRSDALRARINAGEQAWRERKAAATHGPA